MVRQLINQVEVDFVRDIGNLWQYSGVQTHGCFNGRENLWHCSELEIAAVCLSQLA